MRDPNASRQPPAPATDVPGPATELIDLVAAAEAGTADKGVANNAFVYDVSERNRWEQQMLAKGGQQARNFDVNDPRRDARPMDPMLLALLRRALHADRATRSAPHQQFSPVRPLGTPGLSPSGEESSPPRKRPQTASAEAQARSRALEGRDDEQPAARASGAPGSCADAMRCSGAGEYGIPAGGGDCVGGLEQLAGRLEAVGVRTVQRLRRCLTAPLDRPRSPLHGRYLARHGYLLGAPCLLNALLADYDPPLTSSSTDATLHHGHVAALPDGSVRASNATSRAPTSTTASCAPHSPTRPVIVEKPTQPSFALPPANATDAPVCCSHTSASSTLSGRTPLLHDVGATSLDAPGSDHPALSDPANARPHRPCSDSTSEGGPIAAGCSAPPHATGGLVPPAQRSSDTGATSSLEPHAAEGSAVLPSELLQAILAALEEGLHESPGDESYLPINQGQSPSFADDVARMALPDGGERCRTLAAALDRSGLTSALALRRWIFRCEYADGEGQGDVDVVGGPAPGMAAGRAHLRSFLTPPETHLLCQLAQIQVVWGAEAVLFTAPHGIWVLRDSAGAEPLLPSPSTQNDVPAPTVHKPEDWTTWLAEHFARSNGGSSAVWSAADQAFSEFYRLPDPAKLDPNHILAQGGPDATAASPHLEAPWARVLRLFRDRTRPAPHTHSPMLLAGAGVTLHVDMHGRRNWREGLDVDRSDLDLGLAAMAARHPHFTAYLRPVLAAKLREFFAEEAAADDFIVNEWPRLSGARTPSVPGGAYYMTLSQQAVAVGLHSVQVELSLRLRRWLVQHPEPAAALAALIRSSWSAAWKDWNLSAASS